ncbi:MAG: type I-E CRISPR-associated protein Cas5/CasD, partial [Methylococcaceae bacterium]|nr:type I-E CRISPR-associated protein Cas5/CasD [Methylococcaceae bacterium]
MPEFLVFRLYGPLASWGDIAVGEQRPTTPHPSKSAILGLVAAALGIRRDENKRHQDLAAGYGYAVRVDAPGVLLRDYHTTQIPDSTKFLKYSHSRRDETGDRQN